MLEGYSDRARQVVSDASSEARRLQHERLGTEHLLLGLLSGPDGTAANVLRAAGATVEATRHKVAEAVGSSGGAPGEDLPFTARAQRALDRAARFSRQERRGTVEPEHVLLGVLDVEGLACQVLRGLGIEVANLRDGLSAARAEAPAPAPEPPPDAPTPVRCPSCRAPLDDPVPSRVMRTKPAGAAARRVVVLSCPSCGVAIGVVPA